MHIKAKRLAKLERQLAKELSGAERGRTDRVAGAGGKSTRFCRGLHRSAAIAGFDFLKIFNRLPSVSWPPCRDTAVTVAKPATEPTQKATELKARDTGQGDANVAKTTKPVKPKHISGLTAAFMVLVDADKELGVKKIVEIAGEKGWWKSTAATPHATIYAAIIREIGTKADKSRFQRGKKRGTFRAVCSPEQKLELFGKQA